MKVFYKEKTGSVLIEAMVGLSLITLSFGGIIALVSRGLQLNADTLNKFVAVNLATEGIEIVKASLDTKWDAVKNGMYELDYNCTEIGKPPCSTNPLSQTNRSDRVFFRSATGVYSYDAGGTETTFKRSIVTNTDGESVAVYSIVRWTNRGVEQEVQISDTFRKWRKNQN